MNAMPKDTNTDIAIISNDDIKNRIYTIRGMQVMLDRDLAVLYAVETRALNQAVKRNQERFPKDYCFQLTDEEFQIWKSQIVILDKKSGRGSNIKYMPYAFTEAGVLCSLLC